MPRTTIDIDSAVLRELKRRQKREHKTLGTLVSELLARALGAEAAPDPRFTWIAQPMGAKVDLDDKEALAAALEAQ